MRRFLGLLLLSLSLPAVAQAQVVGSFPVPLSVPLGGNGDSTGATVIRGSTSLPGTCSVRDVAIDTDQPLGAGLNVCVATDTWANVTTGAVTGSGAANRFALWSGAGTQTYSDAFQSSTANDTVPAYLITIPYAGKPGLRIKMAGSATARPFEVADSADLVLASVGKNGSVRAIGHFNPADAGTALYGSVEIGTFSGNSQIALVALKDAAGNQTIFENNGGALKLYDASFTRFRSDTNARFGIFRTSNDAQLHVQSNGAATVTSIFQGAAAQSANLTEWRNSSGTVLASVSATGVANFFGANGSNNVAIGGAPLYNESVVVGVGGSTAGSSNVVIGRAASAGWNFGIAIGYSSSTASGNDAALAIGIGAAATAANEAVIGSPAYPYTNMYLGSGKTHSSPGSTTINGTGGSGTNIAGGAEKLAGGKGTGNAAGGTVGLQSSYPGVSGTTLQTLTDRVTAPSKWTTLTESSATAIATLTYGASTAVGAEFLVTVEANDGTDYQSMTYRVAVNSVRKGTGNTVTTEAVIGTPPAAAETAGASTLTCTFDDTEGASAVVLNANCVSSLTQTTLRATIQAQANGPVLVTQN